MQVVDLETAKSARGVRIVSSAIVPSPWSEAAKALFTLAKVPFVVVRAMPRDPAIAAWTSAHNVPVVFHDDEPPRTVWSQILALAARVASAQVLPQGLRERVATTGLIHEIAGEDGLGWNARLMMIHAGLTSNGERGFAAPAAKYLAAKYGYDAARIPTARARAIEILAALGERLGGASYFGGERPDALDAYVATFLTPLAPIGEADCPGLQPVFRTGFAAAAEELGARVPPSLTALRARMFERHLEWPISL
jgi:glutathione S-transferase